VETDVTEVVVIETDAVGTDGAAISSIGSLAVNGVPSTNGLAATNGQKSLKQLATHGSLWTIGGYGISQALRFGTNLVLAKLLFPEAFGLMAIVNGVMQGLVMFSDVGIAQSIMRHTRRDDPDFYNTAWTVQIIRGLLLALVGAVLSWPVGQFYDPFVTRFIFVVALTAAINGFNSTKLFTANRDLQLGRLIIVDVVSQIFSIGVMIGFAWYEHSVWSLVFGAIAASVMKLALSHLVFPGERNRICWQPAAVRELFHFGRWIFLSTVFCFLALQTDKLILGRMLHQEGRVHLDYLGIYSVGFAMIATVTGIFEQLAGRVLMPVMVHATEYSVARFADLLLRSRRIILMTAAVAITDLMLLAPSMFRVLYDARYRDAGWIAQLLGCGMWLLLLQRTSEQSLLALGHSRVMAAANATNFFVTVVAAPIGFFFMGISGFIGGWTLGNLSAVIVMDVALWRFGIRVALQDLVKSAFFAALCAVGFAIRQSAHHYIFGYPHYWFSSLVAVTVVSILGGTAMYMRIRDYAFARAGAR
jgi:O-antigen/teichoic acid export membrane protein